MEINIKILKAEFALWPHGRDHAEKWVYRAMVLIDSNRITLESGPSTSRDHIPQDLIDLINKTLKQHKE